MTQNKTPRTGLQTSRGARQKNLQTRCSLNASYGQNRFLTIFKELKMVAEESVYE
jgi:hypothetical protein